MRFIGCRHSASNPGHDFAEKRARRTAPKNQMVQPRIPKPGRVIGVRDQPVQVEDPQRIARASVVGLAIAADQRGAASAQLDRTQITVWLQGP